MENPDAPETQQIDLGQLMAQVHTPLLRTAIDSAIHYCGAGAIPLIAGNLGAAFQPYREALKNFNPEGMDGPMIEFVNGLTAIVDHAFQIQEEKKRKVILPHEDENP